MENRAANITCPACSAALRFDGGEQKLHCSSCGNDFDTDLLRQIDEATKQAGQESTSHWENEGQRAWSAEERAHMAAYTCPSCGAGIVSDETTAATQCVYCGNPTILPDQFMGDFRPDAVLPFVKTKADAEAAYKELIRGKRLLPKAFSRQGHIDKITGVYVPFWLFECEADADITCRAERVSVYDQGNYTVTETDHYLVRRGGSAEFANVPVDGSTKFDDTLMDAIEPFDHGCEVAFSTAYLPGFQAEKYDVDADRARPRADERIRRSTIDALTDTVRDYSSYTVQSSSVRIGDGRVRNVLIPVWMLNAKWKGETYTFAMNGQTGKIVGNLPVDRLLLIKWMLGIFGGAFVGITAIAFALFATGVM